MNHHDILAHAGEAQCLDGIDWYAPFCTGAGRRPPRESRAAPVVAQRLPSRLIVQYPAAVAQRAQRAMLSIRASLAESYRLERSQFTTAATKWCCMQVKRHGVCALNSNARNVEPRSQRPECR